MSIVVEQAVEVVPTGTWEIDPVWSSLEFEVRKLGLMPIKGRALGFRGTVVGGSEPSLEGSVETSSLTTFEETRDGHLLSPDFFDAPRYPELRFTSSAFEIEGNELVVRGDLTIKGITKPVELRGSATGPAFDATGSERIGLELAGRIDRTAFGLTWNAPLPRGGLLLPNDVVLRGTFAAVRAA